jgi:TRAP-type mannitol/chloroaromatic compound transport system permease small subunit
VKNTWTIYEAVKVRGGIVSNLMAGQRQARLGINRVTDIIATVNTWVARIVSYAVVILAILMTFEVVARYIFNKPTIWVSELSLMFFAALAFLSGGYVYLLDEHVRVDLFYNRLSPRGRALVNILSGLIVFFFVGVFFWQGLGFAIDSTRIMERLSTLWAPPIWPSKWVVPLGCFLLLLQALARFFKDIKTFLENS